MTGEERRKMIIDYLLESELPLSGSKLAKLLDVSRQVIVQDIALLRAKQHNILSTNTGYLLERVQKPQRIFHVIHKDDCTLDELYTIVDLGGYVIDVHVLHRVYGNLSVPLNIKSRKDAKKLVDDINSGTCSLLKKLTQDEHFHIVEAGSTEDFDLIENKLRQKGYIQD